MLIPNEPTANAWAGSYATLGRAAKIASEDLASGSQVLAKGLNSVSSSNLVKLGSSSFALSTAAANHQSDFASKSFYATTQAAKQTSSSFSLRKNRPYVSRNVENVLKTLKTNSTSYTSCNNDSANRAKQKGAGMLTSSKEAKKLLNVLN